MSAEAEELFRRLAATGVSPEAAAEGIARARAAKPDRTRRNILAVVDDLAGEFLFYGRKGDDSLPVFAIEDAILSGVITIDDIVGKLRAAIEQAVANRAANPKQTYP